MQTANRPHKPPHRVGSYFQGLDFLRILRFARTRPQLVPDPRDLWSRGVCNRMRLEVEFRLFLRISFFTLTLFLHQLLYRRNPKVLYGTTQTPIWEF